MNIISISLHTHTGTNMQLDQQCYFVYMPSHPQYHWLLCGLHGHTIQPTSFHNRLLNTTHKTIWNWQNTILTLITLSTLGIRLNVSDSPAYMVHPYYCVYAQTDRKPEFYNFDTNHAFRPHSWLKWLFIDFFSKMSHFISQKSWKLVANNQIY